jgi:hypothetical protein
MLQYSPKITTDGLVMCLDASNNKSYPTDLPVKNGLVMWMDAADDTTFSYSSGTTVSQWRDKSGFNYHMVPKSSGPTRSAVLNSRKVLAFTASQTIGNDVIDLTYTTSTVFVVSRYVAGTNQRVLTCNLDSSGGNWLLGHWGGYVNQYYAEGWVSYQVYGNDTVWRVYMGDYSGVNTDLANIYSNGTAIVTNSTAASGGLRKLGVNYFSGEMSTCEVAEIVVFNRVLSTAERRLVDTYLGQKWGISNTDRSIVDLSGFEDNGILGDGTLANMPVYDYYNKGTLKFNGSSQYFSVTRTLSVPLTISGFVKYIDQSKSLNTFINGRPHNTLAISLNRNGAGNLQVFIGNGSSWLGTPSINSSTTISPEIWYHITFTCDGTTSILYLNGINVGTSANIPSGFGSYFYMGHLTDNASSSEYLKGNIANVQLYTKSLSAVEVLQNYEAQKSKFANTIVQQGLVLNLDAGNPYSYAGAGTTWYDTSGAVNDFTLVNSPAFSANEFILNGTTQYFSISAASGFFISSTNNFYADVGYAWTISVWFKFPVSPTSLRDVTINGGNCSYCLVGNSGGIGGAETIALFVSGISGTSAGFHPYYCVVGVRGSKTQLSVASVNTNTWNNAVVTWNGSAGRGYFNGIDRGALNIGANGMQVSGYTVGATAGGFSSHLFEGSISQTFVYSRAISAAEVLQNYNATKGRFGL